MAEKIPLHPLRSQVQDIPAEDLVGLSVQLPGTDGVMILTGGTITTENPLETSGGGTGHTSLTDGAILVGNGTDPIMVSTGLTEIAGEFTIGDTLRIQNSMTTEVLDGVLVGHGLSNVSSENPLHVNHGGTGAQTFPDSAVLVGHDANPIEGAAILGVTTTINASGPIVASFAEDGGYAGRSALEVTPSVLVSETFIFGVSLEGTSGVAANVGTSVDVRILTGAFGGITTRNIGLYVQDHSYTGGSGSIVSSAGIYLGTTGNTGDDLPAGNWAIYSASTSPSLLGGSLTASALAADSKVTTPYYIVTPSLATPSIVSGGAPVVMAGSGDPTGVAGRNYAIGSIYYRTNGVSGAVTYQKFGTGSSDWEALAPASGGGGANTALSNLSAVAINADLLSGTGAEVLGADGNPWAALYLKGLFVNATGGDGFVELRNQGIESSAPLLHGGIRVFADSAAIKFYNGTAFAALDMGALSAASYSYTLPATSGTLALTSDIPGGGANTALSNLASVAINAALIPGTAGALDVGSTTKPWASVWLAGTSGTPATNQFKITGASTSGVRTITLPDASGTVALTANNLGVFAATTSAQLRGVLSDETGTGLAVFSENPTLAGLTVKTDDPNLVLYNSTFTASPATDGLVMYQFTNGLAEFDLYPAGLLGVDIALDPTAGTLVVDGYISQIVSYGNTRSTTGSNVNLNTFTTNYVPTDLTQADTTHVVRVLTNYGLGAVAAKGNLVNILSDVTVSGNADAATEHAILSGAVRYDIGTGYTQSAGPSGVAWIQDIGYHGPIAVQPQGLNGVVVFTNNYYNGSPATGKSNSLWLTTQKGTGPGRDATHAAANTYPLDVGLGISGVSYNGSNQTGFTTGIQVGGTGSPWGEASSLIGTGLDISQYQTRGIYIHAGSGSPTASIETDGKIICGGTFTAASYTNNLSAFAATTSAQLAGVISDETGSGVLVFATSPTLVTPILGTPTSGTLSNCTGFPASGLSGLGTGVATWLATPSSANLAAAVTGETGTGALVFGTAATVTDLVVSQTANGDTALVVKRITDSAPTGILLDVENAAGTSLCYIDNSGQINAGVLQSLAGATLIARGTVPAAITTAQAGVDTSLIAMAAVAGSSVAGAAAGGNVNITAGDAARLTSGNAAGGNIVFTGGAGIGTGQSGYFSFVTSDSIRLHVKSNIALVTTSTTTISGGNTCGFGSGATLTGNTGVGNSYFGADSNTGETNGITGVRNTSGTNNVYLGFNAYGNANNLTGVVALGYMARATASNMAVVGAKGLVTLQVGSDSSDTSTARVVRAAGARAGTDTDTVGSSLALAGGINTGSAVGGSVLIQTAPAGSTGTTAGTLTTRVTVDSTGLVTATGFVQQAGARSRVNADVTNATTTMANITGLTATVVAGRKYTGRIVLYCADSTAVDGIKVDFDGGGATMTSFRAHGTIFDTALLLSSQTTAIATDFAVATITGDSMIEIYFAFVVNAAGTFLPRVAQNAHTAGTATVYANSHMWLEDTP